MNLIYGYIFKLRMQKDVALCDRILESVDEKRLAPCLLVAILTATSPVRKNLKKRASFYQRSKDAIERLRGPEAAKKILIGLE